MNDDQLREQIDLYVAGMLEDAEREAVERAVREDPRAAAFLAESRRAWAALDQYETEPAPAEIVPTAWHQTRRPAAAWRRRSAGLAVAAGLILAMTGYWRFGRSVPHQPPVALSPQDREVIQHLDFLMHLDMLEQIDLVRRAGMIQDLHKSGLSEFLEALAS